MLLSNTFENIGRMLTGLQFSLKSLFIPFLCKGVTPAIFKQDGIEDDLKGLLSLSAQGKDTLYPPVGFSTAAF